MKRVLPDQDVLLGMLRYDEETGKLFWRVRMSQRVKAGDAAGCLSGAGYIEIKIGGFTHKAHRIVWKMLSGSDPVDQIDHADGNRTNNRSSNLREASTSQNRHNAKARWDGLKGTHRVKNRWIAQIQIDGRRRHLGCFLTQLEAHAAYVSAAEKHFGEFARAA